MIKWLSRKIGPEQPQYSAVETLIIIVLLSIGAAMIFIEIGNIRAHHRDNERKRDIAALRQSVLEYYSLNNRYPLNLASLPNLSPDNCRAPRGHGDCSQPDYQYRAFRAGTEPSMTAQTDCNNRRVACASYIIFSNSMDRTSNPYFVRSY